VKHLIPSILMAAALTACGAKSSSTGGTGPTGGGDGSGTAVAPPGGGGGSASTANLLAAETAAYDQAKPVFDTYCAGCHAQGGAKATDKTLAHLDITTYPFGGHHVATMGPTIKHVLGIDGAKPIMPKNAPGSVQGDELALVTAWAAAWQAADDAGAHPEVADDDDHDDDVDEH